MFIALATLVLAAASQIAHAKPATSLIKPTELDVDIPAGFPVRALDIAGNRTIYPLTSPLEITIPASGTTGTDDGTLDRRSPAASSAMLYLCEAANCHTCYGYDLSYLPVNVCFPTSTDGYTAIILQPDNEGLPYGVTVGTPQCETRYQLRSVNTCYNLYDLYGAPYTNFELVG